MPEPTPTDLVRELRRAVGLFDGAMPITPKQAWEDALDVVAQLRKGLCARCLEKEHLTAWETPSIGGIRPSTHYYGDTCLGGHGELADIEAAENSGGATKAAGRTSPLPLAPPGQDAQSEWLAP